jgi:hypothetical protein
LVGAAFGWQPIVPLQRAVTRYLRRELARDIVAGERLAPKVRIESAPSLGKSLDTLRAALAGPLGRDFDSLAERLGADLRDQPLPELEPEPPAGHERAMECVTSWVESAAREVRNMIAARLAGPGRLRRAMADLGRLTEGLDRRLQALADQERTLAELRRQQANELYEMDRRGVASPRRWLPNGRSRRIRRHLGPFATTRVAELSARYTSLALDQLRPVLEAISVGVVQLQAEARDEARWPLDDVFEPGHPNRVPLLDPASLEQFLGGEIQWLAGESLTAVLAILWRQASAAQLVTTQIAPSWWAAIEHSAENFLASRLDNPDRPLGDASRACVADQYRPESLRAILIRLARPRCSREPGPPAIESHVASSLTAGSTETPFVLTLHWRPARRGRT